jgi:4-hydroxy-2-oxoheptanedioate aldolase
MAAVMAALAASGARLAVQAQGARPNRLIEQYKAGRPAIVHKEWAWINMENSWDPERLKKVLTDLKKEPLTPVLRVPSGGADGPGKFIQIALDLGVANLVIPKIATAEEARRLVAAMRERKAAGGQAAAYWGVSQNEYARKADLWPANPDGELVAIVMIESKAAVDNIEEILRVPGLGGVFIGPYDLGESLGVGPPRDGKIPSATEAAIQKVRGACQAFRKIICGVAGMPIAQKDLRVKEGWNMMQLLEPGVPASR